MKIRGYYLRSITLPDGASLSRTEEVSRKFVDQIKDIDGINKEKLTVFGGNGSVNQSTVIIQLDEYAVKEKSALLSWVIRKIKGQATDLISYCYFE